MIKFVDITIAAIFLILVGLAVFAAPANAGSLSSPWDEPEVQAPAKGCGTMWLTGWPICSSDRLADPDDQPYTRTTTVTETETETECKVDREPREKKKKSDNSDSNKKGGNKHDREDKPSDRGENRGNSGRN